MFAPSRRGKRGGNYVKLGVICVFIGVHTAFFGNEEKGKPGLYFMWHDIIDTNIESWVCFLPSAIENRHYTQRHFSRLWNNRPLFLTCNM